MMGRCIVLGIFMSQVFMSSSLLGEKSFSQQIAVLTQKQDLPFQNQIFYPDQILEEKLFHSFKRISQKQEEKARRLFSLIQENSFHRMDWTEDQVLSMVRFADWIIKKYHFSKHANFQSIIIFPDYKKTFLPIQFYKNGHLYFHFRERDLNSKRGGYKLFSRSISYEKEEIVANLEAASAKAKSLESLVSEVQVMTSLQHTKGILKTLDYDLIQGMPGTQEGEKNHVFIFQTPLYEGDFSKTKIQDPTQVSYDLAYHVNEFHEGGWIHRDIKPSNFFFRKKNEKMESVLADFGLSQSIQNPLFGRSLSGTRGYMDPEICYNRVAFSKSLSSFEEGVRADVFSLGMVFYSFQHPKSSLLREVVLEINRLALPPEGSQRGNKDEVYKVWAKYKGIQENLLLMAKSKNAHYDLLCLKMMDPNPFKRPSLKEVMGMLK
jgi:serine/threonine protein kinase